MSFHNAAVRRRIQRAVAAAGIAALLANAAESRTFAHSSPPPHEDSVVVVWNATLLQAVRNVRFAPMFTARALAIVHTCMYDAWAAYDARAVATRLGASLRRPKWERTNHAKRTAVSFAAYRALADLFPSQRPLFDEVMAQIGLDPLDRSTDPSTAAGVGNRSCEAVLEWRHHDGSNQLGDINGGAPYSDYTGYQPVNAPETLTDPNRWQPLRSSTGVPQSFLAPHWGHVVPFGLTSAAQFRPRPPAQYPDSRYRRQAEKIVELSAALGDREKAIAEYWADGPSTETPPGHWNLLAQFVSRRDRQDLDADIKMFFVLGNAQLDASIAVWESKVAYDYIRPISAIRFLFAGQTIEAWGGPGLGTQLIPGEAFRTYIATPPFAEYTSGHSAFSAASAAVLELFTGSPHFGAAYTFPAGSSTIEPGTTPATDITLKWRTFDDAADEAGLSRRFGGIHFRQGDLESGQIGRAIGRQAWQTALKYFRGSAGVTTRYN